MHQKLLEVSISTKQSLSPPPSPPKGNPSYAPVGTGWTGLGLEKLPSQKFLTQPDYILSNNKLLFKTKTYHV